MTPPATPPLAPGTNLVEVRELIAWGLDDSPHRESFFAPDVMAAAQARARPGLHCRPNSLPEAALMQVETAKLAALFTPVLRRADLQQEFVGLDWSLGVVDLRRLLAFQRRLALDPARKLIDMPRERDWPALLSLAAGQPRGTEHTLQVRSTNATSADIVLETSNPDLHVRVDATSGGDLLPLSLFGGSPFFEVAEFRGRWFLRDGYHRAFHLLSAGIHAMVAVVVHARSSEDIGANQPWFFSEDVLFSTRPPRVADFLSADLTVSYPRPRLTKTILIRVEESFEQSRFSNKPK
jgi:hypothetical protein